MRQNQLYHKGCRPGTFSAFLFIFMFMCPAISFGLPFTGPRYAMEIKVVGNKQVEENLKKFIKEQQSQNLQLKAFEDEKESEGQLSQYTRLLNGVIREKLQALGYYSAQIASDLKEDGAIYRIKLGQQSIIKSIDLQIPAFLQDDKSKLLDVLLGEQFNQGKPLVVDNVIAAQDRLKRYIDRNYCFVGPELEQQVAVVRSSQASEVILTLKTKPEQSIESIEFKGSTSLSDGFLRNVITLKTGCYKSTQVTKAQVDLLQTGLLSSATPLIEELPDNKVKLIFQLQERKHKTQRVGIGYSTDEGARFSLGWESRNWRGNGKNLSADLMLSQITTQVKSELRVPQFKMKKLSLLLQGELLKTQVDAFDSKGARLIGILEYQADRHCLFSSGLSSRYTTVESSTGDDIFRLVSIPTSIQWDRSDALLDPTRRFTWTFGLEPFVDLARSNSKFSKFVTSVKNYYSPEWAKGDGGLKHLTFATRFATGTIQGASILDIPADLRFYTGGGGSVRGFDYQSLSPLVQEFAGVSGDPESILGGRSFVEAALEMRLRLSEQWGAGVFVDAGFRAC